MEDEFAVLSTLTAPGKSKLAVPERNDLFVYTVGRAMHFWPVVNGNNAVWLEEDIKPLYEDESAHKLTFKGTLVNLDHSEKFVIGNTIDEMYIPGIGIDVLNKIDRRQLTRHDVSPDEFAANGEYSKQSVEINCDRSKSRFIVMLKPESKNLADQRIYNADEAASLGIRRTSIADPLGPYYHEGKYKVLEAGVPRGVRGIAMLGNPADADAHVFDVAASKEEHAGTGMDNVGYDLSGLDEVSNDLNTTDPYSPSNGEEAAPDDDAAYAVVQGAETELSGKGASQRELPLYQSDQHLAQQNPHPGLIKSAVNTLKTKPYPPAVGAEAIKRVRAAHKQFKGDKHMTAEELAAHIAAARDPLAEEIATLKTQIATAEGEATALKERDGLKDTEIASLKEEIARLNSTIEDAKKADAAKARLDELAAIEGFEIKDDEKAGLLEALAAESDADFKVRKLNAENTVLRLKLAKGPTNDENAGKNADEIAALQALAGAEGGTENSKPNTYVSLYAKK